MSARSNLIIPRIREASVRREGERILIIEEGKVVFEMPSWEVADAICDAIRAKAREAEEQAKAPQIAADSGLLLRAGVPLGLSSDPKIKDEARKIAAHDRSLRRALPGGIKSSVQLGRPAIVIHPKRSA